MQPGCGATWLQGSPGGAATTAVRLKPDGGVGDKRRNQVAPQPGCRCDVHRQPAFKQVAVVGSPGGAVTTAARPKPDGGLNPQRASASGSTVAVTRSAKTRTSACVETSVAG